MVDADRPFEINHSRKHRLAIRHLAAKQLSIYYLF